MTFRDWWATEQHEAAKHFPPHLLEYLEALCARAWNEAEIQTRAEEWARTSRVYRELTEELCRAR